MRDILRKKKIMVPPFLVAVKSKKSDKETGVRVEWSPYEQSGP